MYKILKFAINVIILMTSINSILTASKITKCRTPSPENETAWCVPIAQCKIFDDIRDVPLEVLDDKYHLFITNSKCSDESEERFCCILNHINREFASINGIVNDSHPDVQRVHSEPITETTKPSKNFTIPKIPNVNRADISNFDAHPNLNLLPDECKRVSPSRRIVGFGVQTELREFPYMALLQFDRNAPFFGCGGTLINEKYVLTAAHCIRSDLFSVRLGEYNTKTEIDCVPDMKKENGLDCNDPVQDIPIESVTLHEHYDRFQAVDDIALIRLTSPANMTKNNVRTVCLSLYSSYRNGYPYFAVLTGWGTTENGSSSDILLKADLFTDTERQKCKDFYYKTYNVNVTDKLICAKGDKQEDSCKGDSGGPLLDQGHSSFGEIDVQFGIVASGPSIRCGESIENGGSLYTNVDKYKKWILDNIKP